MINTLKNRSLAIAGLACVSLLTACLNDSDSSGSGVTRMDIKQTGRVLEYDADSATLVVENYEYYCDSTDLIKDTIQSVSRYQIASGQLKVWDDGECYTDLSLSGSSSTLVGRWTSASYNQTTLVPTAYRPPGCAPVDELPAGIEDYLFGNGSLTLDIKADSTLSQSARVDFCFGRYLVLVLSGDTAGISQMGCSNANLTDTSDTANTKTAQIRTELDGNIIKATFSHDGTTCALKMYNPFSGADENTVCTEPESTNETAFLACVESTEYFEGSIMAKKSGQSLESELRTLARPFR